MNTACIAAILIAAALLTSCSSGSANERPEVLVFAAASLTNALEKAVDAYEQANDGEIYVSYAGSQRLAHQIASGAPAHLFLSAGEHPVEFLRQRGLIRSEVDLLSNKLVAIANRPLDDDSVNALSSPSIERIALADPNLAPAGAYAREALQSAGLWDALQPKIVIAPHVRAAVAFVEAGNADAAIVYATDAAAAKNVHTADILQRSSYKPIVYPLVTLESDDPLDAADAFARFLSSPDASGIFRSHGFEPLR